MFPADLVSWTIRDVVFDVDIEEWPKGVRVLHLLFHKSGDRGVASSRLVVNAVSPDPEEGEPLRVRGKFLQSFDRNRCRIPVDPPLPNICKGFEEATDRPSKPPGCIQYDEVHVPPQIYVELGALPDYVD